MKTTKREKESAKKVADAKPEQIPPMPKEPLIAEPKGKKYTSISVLTGDADFLRGLAENSGEEGGLAKEFAKMVSSMKDGQYLMAIQIDSNNDIAESDKQPAKITRGMILVSKPPLVQSYTANIYNWEIIIVYNYYPSPKVVMDYNNTLHHVSQLYYPTQKMCLLIFDHLLQNTQQMSIDISKGL